MIFRGRTRSFIALGIIGVIIFVVFSRMDIFGKKPDILWKIDFVESPRLVIEGDTIYAWSYDDTNLTTIDKHSGKITNEYNIGLGTYGSDLADGMFFKKKGSEGFELLALDLKTWREKWSRNIEDYEKIPRAPAVRASNGRVYVGVKPNKIAAFDYESGTRVWNYETVLRTDPDKSPYLVADDGILLIGFDDGSIHALDVASGRQIWKFETGMSLPHAMLVKDGVAYVDVYETTYALDAQTGKKIWKTFSADLRTAFDASNGVLYIAQAFNSLRAVDRNGRQLWQRELPDMTTKIVISEGVLYYGTYHDSVGLDFSSDKSNFYAVDPQTGEIIWQYKMKDLISTFEVDNDVVYLSKWNSDELIALKNS